MNEGPSDIAGQVFKEIDSMLPEQLRFLQTLIRIPTVNPPGRYEEITRFLQSYLQKQELQVDLHETPPEICKAAGIETDERRLSSKIIAGKRNIRPRILLLAHLDTVPPGDLSSWRHDPFGGEVVDGRIYGRGACDCKGRLATYLFAQLALVRTLKELPCELIVAATADEEIGGHTGAKYLLETGQLDCDYCIGEGYTWEVFNGFKGLLWIRISIKGKTAHGATPHLGVSTVKPLEDLLRDVRGYQAKLNALEKAADTTVNVGVISAGTKINMVPDSAEVEIDFRIGGSHRVQQVINDVTAIVHELEMTYSNVIFKFEILNQSEPIAISSDHPLIEAVHSSVEQVTKTKIPIGLWFAHSDTLHFLRKGVPSVNYGVGKAGVAHIADEYVDLDDLRLSTKAVALSIIKLMNG